MSSSMLEAQPAPTATETMRAVVVRGFDVSPHVEEVAKPEAGPDEVVVKIEASGLCHTDIHAAHGDWPVKPKLPFTPGHEGAGIVESLGFGVTDVEIGDRVAIPWLGYACGTCDYCISGWETLCESQRNTGYSIDGGFAEYAKAFGRHVVKVPNGVDPFDAAPLTCAGVTAYKAVKVSGAKPAALPPENTMELPIFETVLNGITVVGSIVGTRLDLREVFQLHAAGKTRVIREERPLEDIEHAMDDVLTGDVPARIVFRP